MVESVGGALNISMLGRATIAPADTECAVAALADLPTESSQAMDELAADPLNWSRIDDATLLPIAEAYIGCVDEDQLNSLIAFNSLKIMDAECVVEAWDGLLSEDVVAASVTYNSGLEDLEPALVEQLAALAAPCGQDRQWWIDDVAIELVRMPMADNEAQCVATAYVDSLGIEEVLRRRLLGVPLLDVPVETRQQLALAEQCGTDPPPLNPPLNAAIGTCLSGFGQGRSATAIVDCEQPHNGEVFAVHDLAALFGQWPGLRTLQNAAHSSCRTDVEALSGDLDGYGVGWDIPSRSAWELGDRALTCALIRGPDYAVWRGPSGLVPGAAPTTLPATTVSAAPTLVELHSLTVGQCLYGEQLVDSDLGDGLLEVVDCSQPHHAEVYHVSMLEDPAGAPWPGEDHPRNSALARCHPDFDAYVGRTWADSRFGFTYVYPSEAEWEADDRLILCYLWDLEGEILTGSMAGSGQ